MTDQRTLKRIIGEQRGTIEKQKLVIEELNDNYLKLDRAYDEAAQTANTYALNVCKLLAFFEELKKSAQPQSMMWQAGFSHAFDNVERRTKELFPNHVALSDVNNEKESP